MREIVMIKSKNILSKHPSVNKSNVGELEVIVKRAPFDMRHGNWKTFGASDDQVLVLNETFNQGLSYHDFKNAVSIL